MSPLGLAARTLRCQPARSLLGMGGIAIVGALLLDMLLLSRGLVLSFRELLDATGYDVRITATEALPGGGPPILEAEAAAEALRRLPEVETAVPIRWDLASAALPNGRLTEVTVVATGPRRRGDWTILRGRDLGTDAPGDLPEVVVSEALARRCAVEPGSVLSLRGGRPAAHTAAPPSRFRVAGVAEFPFEVAGERTAAMPLPAFRAAQIGEDRDEADLILVSSRRDAGSAAAVEAIRRARPDLHAFSTEEFLARFQRTDFSYFRQLSFVLSFVTSVFAFLLVATLLTVTTNQRLGEVAALRALGFTRKRVALDLLAESALLVGAGALLALPAGVALARVLDDILRGMPGLPVRLHFFVFEPRAVALLFALLGLAGLLAALYPVLVVARLPIAATLRREVS